MRYTDTDRYVVLSLELHLFFARIMKEHSLFLQAGFTPRDRDYAQKASFFMNQFEQVLREAVRLSDCVVSPEVLSSGEVVTEFTLDAESQTQRLSSIEIDTRITKMEQRLRPGNHSFISSGIVRGVRALNRKALRLLDGLIEFKENILCNVDRCRMFTMNYPLLIEHILREARLYRTCLCNYEKGRDFDCQTLRELTSFWNRIMMEHAMFIRGLLDPTEETLFNTADEFAEDFARLLEQARDKNDMTIAKESLAEAVKIRDFKAAGAKGILECEIRSIILPLLADHVLREANHYIRLLQCES
jgi:hypothetical protein